MITPYTPAHADAVRALARAVQEHDGVEAFGEQTIFNLTEFGPTHVLITEGRVAAGYAQLDRGSAELAVHPDHRRRGIGTHMLNAVKSFSDGARIWAHGNLPGAQALAARQGLTVVRELIYMTAPLTARAVPQPPAGISVRTYTPADADEWLSVNAAAFASHPEQGRLTRADLEERQAQEWFDPRTFWLAHDEAGALEGFMWVKRFPTSASAEIYVLGVSPSAQGRGLGKFLTEHALAHMHAAGVVTMDLYVEGDNTPALATYEAYGFTRAITHVQYA